MAATRWTVWVEAARSDDTSEPHEAATVRRHLSSPDLGLRPTEARIYCISCSCASCRTRSARSAPLTGPAAAAGRSASCMTAAAASSPLCSGRLPDGNRAGVLAVVDETKATLQAACVHS